MSDRPEDVAAAARATFDAVERELERWVVADGEVALDGLDPNVAADLLARARGAARVIARVADRLDAVAERRRSAAPAAPVVEHRLLASALDAWAIGKRWQAIFQAGMTPSQLAGRLRLPREVVTLVLSLRDLPEPWTARLAAGDEGLAGLTVSELLEAAAS